MIAGRSEGESSISHRRRSRASRLWEPASSRFGSPGRTPGAREIDLGRLARRHGVAPSKSLGQHFLIDTDFARAIAADARVGPGDDVVEIGAGLGSLTRALAEADADRVLAIEFDRKLLPALAEAVAEFSNVRILAADASKLDWEATLGEGDWTLCANLPYNVATPLLKTVLAGAHAVRRLVVMVQTEVGDRLVATPGQPAYGPLSIEVAYHAAASFVRSVPPEVFWPRPKVGSVVVRLERLDRPPVDVDHAVFRRVVATAFTARRKTIRAALRPLTSDPDTVLATARVPASARPGTLSIEAFARIAEAVS